MGIGEWAGLTTAALWAISSLFYAKVRLGAWTLNFAKNAIGCAILGVQLVLVAQWTGTPLLNASPQTWSLMALSGLIGILVGDTFFFRSLQVLGPRRALMLATTAPLFAAVLGWVYLGESMDWRRAGGMLLTLTGVGFVISDQRANVEAPGLYPGTVWVDALCGILAALCQAIGAAIAKQGMADCDAATATFIRLLVASSLGLLLIAQTRRRGPRNPQQSIRANLAVIVPGAMLGTWLGIWFSQIAIKHSDIAVATTLMTTCPLFAIPLVRVLYKHPVRPLALVGTSLAILGVYIVAS